MNQILIILTVAVLLIFGLAWYNDSQANRIEAQARAESMIIRAQAEATALTLAAAVPLVFGSVGLICSIALVVFAFRFQRNNRPPELIERQIIYVLPAGQPRRELWQTLSDTRQLEPVKRNEIIK